MTKQEIKEIWGLKVGQESNQFDQEKVLLEIVDLAVAEREKEIVEYLNRLDGKNSLFGYQTAIRDVKRFMNPS